jgi:hypothetical protein
MHRFEHAFNRPRDPRRLQQLIAQPAAQFVGIGQKLQMAQRPGRTGLSGKSAQAPGDAGTGILRPHSPADNQQQVALQQALLILPCRLVPRLELPSQCINLISKRHVFLLSIRFNGWAILTIFRFGGSANASCNICGCGSFDSECGSPVIHFDAAEVVAFRQHFLI